MMATMASTSSGTSTSVAAPSAVACLERSRKRVLTGARREQNRANQRVFRQKQRAQRRQYQPRCHVPLEKKPNLQPRLENEGENTPEIVNPARALVPVLVTGALERGPNQSQRSEPDSAATRRWSPVVSTASFFNSLPPFSDVQDVTGLLSVPSPFGPLPLSEESSLDTLLSNFELPSLRSNGYMNTSVLAQEAECRTGTDLVDISYLDGMGGDWPELIETPQQLPHVQTEARPECNLVPQNGQNLPVTDRSFDLEQVIAAGLEVLLRSPRSGVNLPSTVLPHGLPSPRMTSVQFHPEKIILACFQNALSMGFLAEDVMMPKCFAPSPFHRTIKPDEDPKQLLAAVIRPSTPANLKPTLPQLLYPHPAFMDLIPMLVFRVRVITLVVMQSYLLNMVELKKDMVVEDGFVLWSPTGSGMGSNWRNEGQGQPWDIRSWEAAPWFLRKWRMLVDGEDGEVWKQSLWWQRAREVNAGR